MRFTRWDNVSLETRFWSKVQTGGEDECWLWLAGKKSDGYGRFTHQGKSITAPRIAWLLTHGEIPVVFVCHSCDNPPCCNPKHLFLGTITDNNADRKQKGRYHMGHIEQPNQKLDWDKVGEIRKLYATGEWTGKQLGEKFGVTATKVYQVTTNRSWKERDSAEVVKPARRVPRHGGNSTRAKLTNEQAQEIRARFALGGLSYEDLAQAYQVPRPLIGKIIRHEAYSAGCIKSYARTSRRA